MPPAPGMFTVRLVRPSGYAFEPGQFAFLGIGDVRKAMSIASSPTRDLIQFAVRLSDSPFKQAFAKLRPGDPVLLSGPRGRLSFEQSRPAVMVAGGIGITTSKAMIEYAADSGWSTPITLLYSNRSAEEIAFRTELDALAAQNPHFQVVHTLTGEAGPDWTGRVGRIDGPLLDEHARPTSIFYVIGPPGFVVGTVETLRDMGIPTDRIQQERFMGYDSV